MQDKFIPMTSYKGRKIPKPKRIEDQSKKASNKKKSKNFPKGYRVTTGRPSILRSMPILPQKSNISQYKLY